MPTPVPRRTPEGTAPGPAVAALYFYPDDSPAAGAPRPLLLRPTEQPFGVHALLCDAASCAVDARDPLSGASAPRWRPAARQRLVGTAVRTLGAVAWEHDPARDDVRAGRPLLDRAPLDEAGAGDVEAEAWRVLERLACRGAWAKEGLCANAHEYLAKGNATFVPWDGDCAPTYGAGG